MSILDIFRGRPSEPGDGASVSSRTHVLLFDDPKSTLEAVRHLRRHGFAIEDVLSPFPVHGLEEALEMPQTRLPWATFVGGLAGLTLALAMQSWVHAVDWPLNIGGKSNLALASQVPVAFELTVLLAAIGTVGALFVLLRLFPLGARTRSPEIPDPRVSDDLFAVLVAETSGAFDARRYDEACDELSPVERVDGWRIR